MNHFSAAEMLDIPYIIVGLGNSVWRSITKGMCIAIAWIPEKERNGRKLSTKEY